MHLDDLPIIDSDVIAELRHLALEEEADGAFLTELVTTYVALALPLLEDIASAVGQADSYALAHYAQRLKGCSRNLGLARMTAVCELLEQEGKRGRAAEADELLLPLTAQFFSARVVLEKLTGNRLPLPVT